MQNVDTSIQVGAAQGARTTAPVFVLGCPRSGTTLLYHMLLSAGNFAVYRAESQVFNLLEPRFGDLSRAANRRKMLAAWQDTELFRRTGLNSSDISEDVMANCRNGGDFLRIFMEAMARRQGVQRWADCTPEHLLYLDRIKQTIPNALIIHIIRDGRDVALSLEKQAWIRPFAWDRRKTLEVAAVYWEWIVRRGREAGRTLGGDYVEIRFEDLVLNPRRVLEGLSGFVAQELDYDKIQHAGIGSVSEPNSSFVTEIKQGEFSPVCRWKTGLEEVQRERLDILLRKTLQELGYELDSSQKQPSSYRSSPRGSLKRGSLLRMRRLYQFYFDAKLGLKKNVELGKMLVSSEMPSFEQRRSRTES